MELMGHFGLAKRRWRCEQARLYRFEPSAIQGKPTTIYISSPNAEDPAQLNWSDAVAVYLEPDRSKLKPDGSRIICEEWAPPLRIELMNDQISALWTEPRRVTTHACDYVYKSIDEELARLSATLAVGMARAEANRQLLSFKTLYRIRMTASALRGYKSHLSVDPFGEREVQLLRTDVWEFEGLRELTSFNPPYSRVTLYFEGDKLRKIRHWTFPVEFP